MQKTLVKKEELKTATEKVEALFEKYIDTTGAILEDYVVDDGMITELSAADSTLKKEIISLIEDDQPDFDSLVEKLTEHNDYDADKILDVIDEDDINSFIEGKNYIYIKTNSLSDRNKIEEFLTTQIYPYVSDQQSNIIM